MYERGMPYTVKVNKGETVHICQCGLTNNSPFCDGSHKNHPTAEPLNHTAEKNETLYVCGCGKTGNAPFCDGSHNRK